MTVTPLLILTAAFGSIIAVGTLVTWLYDTLAAAHVGRHGVARLAPIGSHGVTRTEARDEARRSLGPAAPAPQRARRNGGTPMAGTCRPMTPTIGSAIRDALERNTVTHGSPFPERLPHAKPHPTPTVTPAMAPTVTVRRGNGHPNAA